MTKAVMVADGKAATVVSPSQLAINVGSRAGVEVGDYATVRKSVKVADPDSAESLGVFHLTRLRLRVTIVSDAFSVAEVIEKIPTDGLIGAFDVTRINRFKTMTTREADANANVIFVQPGESVLVTRVIEDDEDE